MKKKLVSLLLVSIMLVGGCGSKDESDSSSVSEVLTPSSTTVVESVVVEEPSENWDWHLQEQVDCEIGTFVLDKDWSKYVTLSGDKYNWSEGLSMRSYPYYENNHSYSVVDGDVLIDDKMFSLCLELESPAPSDSASIEGVVSISYYAGSESGKPYFGDWTVNGIHFEAPFSYKTNKIGDGVSTIGIGNTRDEVLAVLGEPAVVHEPYGACEYHVDDCTLLVMLYDDYVISLDISKV